MEKSFLYKTCNKTQKPEGKMIDTYKHIKVKKPNQNKTLKTKNLLAVKSSNIRKNLLGML